MSFSNEDLPGNFILSGLNQSVSYSSNGTRLSNHVQDKSKQIYLRLVSVNVSGNQTNIKPISGTQVFLDVNPKSFSINMSKALEQGAYTRAGFIPQFWGDELDTISVQGSSSAFTHTEKGLTRQEANSTTGYKNFMALLALYKSNGAKFHKYGTRGKSAGSEAKKLSQIKNDFKQDSRNINSTISSSRRKVIDSRYLVELRYSDLQVYGTFDSFTYSDSVDSPFKFDYSFEFTVLFYAGKASKIDGHLGK